MMKNFQASCDDGWKSKMVQAATIDAAADMVSADLVAHVKEVHNMDLPTDPAGLHKSVVDHTHEVMQQASM